MFKININNISRGSGLLKSKREMYLLALFIFIIFLRLFVPGDLKKIKNANLENLAKQEELNRKKTEFFSIESLLKDQQRYEEEYNQISKVSESLDKQIAESKNALVAKEKVAEILNELTSITKSGDIEFILITTAPMVKYEKYDALSIKMKINARYSNLMSYIKSLESLPFLLDIKRLTVSSPKANGFILAETELVMYVSK
ncbi:MAG: type 4a pilus biogenesis protein PilO [Candidatus Omnitrophica bacterium]|nr:type 4a pilus biogenesis protein PilO [Candidatus Omnitrophota bacterium]